MVVNLLKISGMFPNEQPCLKRAMELKIEEFAISVCVAQNEQVCSICECLLKMSEFFQTSLKNDLNES